MTDDQRLSAAYITVLEHLQEARDLPRDSDTSPIPADREDLAFYRSQLGIAIHVLREHLRALPAVQKTVDDLHKLLRGEEQDSWVGPVPLGDQEEPS